MSDDKKTPGWLKAVLMVAGVIMIMVAIKVGDEALCEAGLNFGCSK